MTETTQLFDVQGMSCQHCVKAVTRAVQSLDPKAEVSVDLPSNKVTVKSEADRGALTRAIAEEGYKVRS